MSFINHTPKHTNELNLADDAAAAKRKARVDALAESIFITRQRAQTMALRAAAFAKLDAEQAFIEAEAFIAYAESK